MAGHSLVAVSCLAAAAAFGVVAWGQPPTAAGAGGEPCPADVDNDGQVGITDFLAVIGAWGPCLSATIVDVAVVQPFPDDRVGVVVVRLWSDGAAEYQTQAGNAGQMPSVEVWTPLPVSPKSPAATAAAISGAYKRYVAADGYYVSQFVRVWADGSADTIKYHLFDDGSADEWTPWTDF